MLSKKIILFGTLGFVLFSLCLAGGGEDFKVEKISDRLVVLKDPTDGAGQLAVITKKGAVIFNSFWSGITASKFKKGWVKVLKGKKIIYNINTVDRLDIFGGNAAYKKIAIVGHHSFLNKFKKKEVDAEIKRLINMWRCKEYVSRKRLPSHKPGSKKEKIRAKVPIW